LDRGDVHPVPDARFPQPNGIPGAEEFNLEVVNYAPLTAGAAFLLFGGWYVLSARNWFTGPRREARRPGPENSQLTPIRYEHSDGGTPRPFCRW
jgi:hypothetical protein